MPPILSDMANDSGPPELVLFDLGGVLCRFEPDRRAAELAAAIGVTEDEIHALVFASGFDQECDLGIHSETAILERFRRLGFPGDRDELRRAWAKAFIPDRAVIDLAIALRSEGVVVATLSDNGPVLLAAIESVVTPSAIDEHVFFLHARSYQTRTCGLPGCAGVARCASTADLLRRRQPGERPQRSTAGNSRRTSKQSGRRRIGTSIGGSAANALGQIKTRKPPTRFLR